MPSNPAELALMSTPTDVEEVHSSFYDLQVTNTNMSQQLLHVYGELEEIIVSYFWGISMSCLSNLENSYRKKFIRSLDYQSLGVSNIKKLLDNMAGKNMVVLYENRESKEEYVMSARMAEFRRKHVLKPHVQKLIYAHHGEILFSSFDDSYKDQFNLNLNYHYYGLTGLEDLCVILKDILVVRVLNRSGAKVKVIKPVECVVYNLRKRKK
ncbi:hypothetical protein CTI12_AA090550 [Artemisia annua]|uniref:HTH OST-type domain-containing protein n=1 Tax=Artemisia annua TaxID=35608 RepID=A0A2U1PZS2_ARTAN|nr:hypothetical protein CTI12_AA090550 [Artemisia annua]